MAPDTTTTTASMLDKPSRLEFIHACVFTIGFFLSAAGLFFSVPQLLLVSGPCLALSAVLIWVGIRVQFAGVVGQMLRRVLGPSRLVSMHARAATWLVIGVGLTVWSILELSHPPAEQPLEPPTQLGSLR